MFPCRRALAVALLVLILCGNVLLSSAHEVSPSPLNNSERTDGSSRLRLLASGVAPSLEPLAPPIRVGVSSSAIAVDPTTNTTYVANMYSKTVSVISVAPSYSLSGILPTIDNPTGLMVDSQDHLLFVESYNYSNFPSTNGTIESFSTSSGSLVGSAEVGAFPWGMVVTPHPHELFVANYYGGGLSILSVNPLRVLTSLNLTAYGLAYDPIDGMVFAASDVLNGSVIEIDPVTNSILDTIKVGGTPEYILFNPWNGLLYVPCSADSDGIQNSTYVINTAAGVVVAVAPLPANPGLVALDSANGDVIVATSRFTNQRQFYDGNLTVISEASKTVVANLPIDAYFYGLVSDNATGALYLLDHGNLTVLSGTTASLSYTVAVNVSAYLVAVNPDRGALFIVDPSYDIYSTGEVDVYQAPMPISTVSTSAGNSFPILLVLGASVVVGAAAVLLYTMGRRRTGR